MFFNCVKYYNDTEETFYSLEDVLKSDYYLVRNGYVLFGIREELNYLKKELNLSVFETYMLILNMGFRYRHEIEDILYSLWRI
jgi:hypothetical protein